MTLKELEPQLLALTPVERAAAIHLLTRPLNHGSSGINKTPGVVGGDACVGNTRIPVWSLVSYRRLEASDAFILEAFPQLSAADLVNAWAYAEAHPEEIEQAIQENDDTMDEAEEN